MGKTKWVIEERYYNRHQRATVIEIPFDAPMQQDDVDGLYDMYRTAYRSRKAAEKALLKVLEELANC